jgi:membrane protein implicated in regulation of membrane protease activity
MACPLHSSSEWCRVAAKACWDGGLQAMYYHPHVSAGLIVLVVAALLIALLMPWWVVVLVCALVAVPAILVSPLIRRALRRPARVGAESLAGSSAVVVRRNAVSAALPYVVRLGGELWSARSPEELAEGDRALVLGVEGNHLLICRMPPGLAHAGEPWLESWR